MPTVMDPISQGVNAGVNVFSNIANFLQNRALFNEWQNVANDLRGGSNFERQLMLSLFDSARQNALGQNDIGQLLSTGTADNPGILLQALSQYGDQQNLAKNLFSNLGITNDQSRFIDPLLQWAGGQQAQGEAMAGQGASAQQGNAQLRDLFSSLLNGGISTAGLNAGNEMLENRGRNAEGDYINSILQGLTSNGGKTADLSNISDIAKALYASGGRTGALDTASQRALQLLTQQDPYAAQGLASASQILNSGGATQSSQAGTNVGLDILRNGGATPVGDQATTAAMQRLMSNPMMNDGEALGLLSSQIGSQAVRNAAAANRQAYLRGGGPGATLASGAGEQARRDASAAGLEAESKAMTDFLMGREKMRLDDRNQAGALVSNLMSSANQRLGTGADLVQSLENSNTSRYGTGGNLLSSLIGRNLEQAQTGFGGLNQTEGTALNRLQTGLNAGLGASGQASQNVLGGANTLLGNRAQNTQDMTAGQNLQNSYFGNLFGAANGMNQSIANDLGMSQQGLQFMNAAADRLNQGANQQNAAQGLNLQAINSYLNSLGQSTAGAAGIGTSYLNYGQNANNLLGQMAQSFNNGYVGLLNGLPNVFRPMSPLGGH